MLTHNLPGSPRSLFGTSEVPEQRFLSKEACRALADRIIKMTTGGGSTYVGCYGTWRGNLRWARNQATTGGDVQNTTVSIGRTVFGSGGSAQTNALDDATLKKMVQHAEQLRLWSTQSADSYPVPYQDKPYEQHPISSPKIWFDSTYNLSAEARAQVLEPIVAEANKVGLLTAGYIELGADAYSVIYDTAAMFRYYPLTTAQFSVTVRDARGTRSGWAGVDFSDWQRIDPLALARIALDKCERSKNPVAVEPGRFTAILEPQAVCDLFEPVMQALSRELAEGGMGPFAGTQRGFSKIGERVLDERLTVSSDPMDPDLGYVPFDTSGEPYIPVNWVERGILKNLSYGRYYGITNLQKDRGLGNVGSYRMSGGTATKEEMIASTERGVLVTRFHGVFTLDDNSLLSSGVTRDGLWLIEKGKISKPIKNFKFTESPLFALNNVEQLGVPQRVFHPRTPVVCPILKVRDFSFTGLMDAV